MISIQPVRNIVYEDEKAILLTLLYFDIFHYPLTESEIISYSPYPLDDKCTLSLTSLLDKKIIYCFEDYYTLSNNDSLIERRKAGNNLATRRMKTARIISVLISFVPFVRAVMLSGSISKGYMDSNSDIDYFIVTQPGRLWVVRSILALVRRLLFFNSHRYLCTNYFIDTDHLEIEEKNIFTAIEVATLKPMAGDSVTRSFFLSNRWYRNHLPNHQPPLAEKKGFRRSWIETIVPSSALDRIDSWLMKQFVSRWKKSYRHTMAPLDFSIAFQSDKHVSRSHPGFYQKKVLTSYQSKITEFENRFDINIGAL